MDALDAVSVARRVHQLVRHLRVVLAVVVLILGQRPALYRDRRARGLAQAFPSHFVDRLPVQRPVVGVPHPRIAECVPRQIARRRVRVQVEPGLRPGLRGARDHLAPVRLQLRPQISVHTARRRVDVDVPVQERIPGRVLVRNDVLHEAVEVNVLVVPVALPAFANPALARLMHHVLQMPRADRIGHRRLEMLRRDQQPGPRELLEERQRRSERLGVDQTPGLRVDRLEPIRLVDSAPVPRAARQVLHIADPLHIQLHRVRVDRGAVLEDRSRAHREDVGHVVRNLHVRGQHRDHPSLVVEAQHSVVDVAPVAQRVAARDSDVRVEPALRILEPAVLQHPPAPRAAHRHRLLRGRLILLRGLLLLIRLLGLLIRRLPRSLRRGLLRIVVVIAAAAAYQGQACRADPGPRAGAQERAP